MAPVKSLIRLRKADAGGLPRTCWLTTAPTLRSVTCKENQSKKLQSHCLASEKVLRVVESRKIGGMAAGSEVSWPDAQHENWKLAGEVLTEAPMVRPRMLRASDSWTELT